MDGSNLEDQSDPLGDNLVIFSMVDIGTNIDGTMWHYHQKW